MKLPAALTREGLKRRLAQRFYTRFHMSLILSSSALAAMLASWAMLHAGVTSMLARYPVALTVAYLTFLAGVWAWLRYVGFGRDSNPGSSLLDGADLPDIRIGGGGGGGSGSGAGGLAGKGGGFDGGGASASWAEARGPGVPANLQAQAFAVAQPSDAQADLPTIDAAKSGGSSGGSSSKGGFDLGGIDLDGEGIVLLVLALALVAAVFLASGYLVWFAPDILTEAAFGAMLAGGLARRSKREDAGGWVAGVVKKTWWPFALVLVMAMIFAGYAGRHYPQAHTFREAIAAALKL